MPRSGCSHSVRRWLVFCALPVALGCEPKTEPVIQTGSARRANDVAASRLAENKNVRTPPSDVPVRPARPTDTQPAAPPKAIEAQIPDPTEGFEFVSARLAGVPSELQRIAAELKEGKASPVQRLALEQKQSDLTERQDSDRRILPRLEMIRRPNVIRLTLKDAIRRALLHNYQIQVAAYAPAIDAGRVVEAEAQFDAVMFSNFSYQNQNRPASSQLSGTNSDNRVWEAGVKKLLSSGMQVQAGYTITRTLTDLIYQTLNPAYFNQFFVEFRQPFLRGFGLDYNRSRIELRKLDRGISEERLKQQLREDLFNVEQAYWRLLQARRGFVVSARLVTELETIVKHLDERFKLNFDVYKVQVALARSRYEQRMAEFVRARAQVMDAEDRLKALMSDPEINLAADLEIIPTDAMNMEPLVVDIIGEVAAALDFRSELHEARLQIEQAKVAIGVAKNQSLPQLDLTFRYVVDGLGANWNNAFSQASDNDFNEYLLQLQLEWPIGARAGEAQIRQARLQQAQAIAQRRAQIEQVILETQTAIRDLHTSYDQIGPSLRSAQASEEQLVATKLRMERKDLANLQVELDAHELLATSRQNLVRSLADYNVAIINLERRKGTLLRYNNIVLNPLRDDSVFAQYAPIGP